MSRLRLTLPAVAAAAIALTAPTVAAAAPTCRGAHAAPRAARAATIRHATLCLLNRQRARHGLPRLRTQGSLGHAAGNYARLMVSEGFFGHVSPAGSTMSQRIERTQYLRGVHGWTIGENLAWGAGGAASPASIVKAWMGSPPHRRNILDARFREIGIGVAQGAPSPAGAAAAAATYVTEFGRRVR